MKKLKEIIEQLRDYPIEIENIDLSNEDNQELKQCQQKKPKNC